MEVLQMRNEQIPAIVVIARFLCALVSMAVAAQDSQDKYTVKAPNGVAFSEFRGYENCQDVGVSRTGTDVKAILANPVRIKAYREGIPRNGKQDNRLHFHAIPPQGKRARSSRLFYLQITSAKARRHAVLLGADVPLCGFYFLAGNGLGAKYLRE
jgi:hypothetical protein